MGGGVDPFSALFGGGSQGESAEEKRDREQMEQNQRDLKEEEEEKNRGLHKDCKKKQHTNN